MAQRYGNLKIATADSEIFPNAKLNDMMIYTETSNQKIQLGTTIGSRSMVTINNSNTEFAGIILPVSNALYDIGSSNSRFRDVFLSNINLAGTIYQANGTPFVSGSSLTGLSNNSSNVFVMSGSNFGVGTSNARALLHVAGNAYVQGSILGSSNASNLPSYSWSNDPSSGMYSASNGVIGFSVSGSQIAAFNKGGMSLLGNIRMSDVSGGFTANGVLSSSSGSGLPADGEVWTMASSNASYIGLSNSKFYGIGKSNPQYKLDVVGDIYASGNIVAFSDERYKTNVQVIENALEKTLAIRGYTYNIAEKKYAGVIAQEVQRILPEVVETDSQGMLSVAYGNMNALLIQAIHELTARVEALEKSI